MIKHLSDQEAIEKMQAIANRQVCFLGTYTNPYRQDARPMTTLEVDEEGNFLFFIKDDPSLMILEVKPTSAHYWTTADGKIVTLHKMAKATLAGEEVNIGVTGDLNI